MTDLAHSIEKARAVVASVGKRVDRVHTWPVLKEGEQPAPETDSAANPARRDFSGIPVVIDRPKGFVQEGVGADGNAWRRVYHVDYGHIRHVDGTDQKPGTLGGDGDGLDVFVGGDDAAKEAHWILQRKADGSFDEYKVMLGFSDRESAKAMYFAHVPKRFFGSICSMSIEMMKALLGIEPVESVAKALIEFQGLIDSVQNATEETAARAAVELLAGQEREVRLAKAEPGSEQRYVLGIVLEPEVVDAQGDIYSEEEIRKSAWNYMVHFRNVGLMHKGLINGKVRLVENYIAPIDMTIDGSSVRKGTWLMGLHFDDDDLWGKVKTGELTGLSIGGFAKRTEV